MHLLWAAPGFSLPIFQFHISLSAQVSVVSVCLVVASLALGCVTFLIYRYATTHHAKIVQKTHYVNPPPSQHLSIFEPQAQTAEACYSGLPPSQVESVCYQKSK